MRLMGFQAVLYPKRRLTVASKEHKTYPYLLRSVEVKEPDQVWSADITYIRMLRGFLCLCGHYGLVQLLCADLGAVYQYGKSSAWRLWIRH